LFPSADIESFVIKRTRCGERYGILPFARAAKDGAPTIGAREKENRKGLAIRPLTSVAFRRFVYPPFASILSSVRITDPAGRKGWGTQSMVSERKNGKGRPADNYEIEYG